MTENTSVQYIIKEFAAIEDFGDESLVFLPMERRLVKINSVTREILKCLDGKRTAEETAQKIASLYEVPLDSVQQDVLDSLAELKEQGVIKDVNIMKQIRDAGIMDETRYSINHDISCRREEPEGAILFDPETDAVKAINPIGLTIWQALEYPRKKSEVVEVLLETYEDAPLDQVAKDVEEFVDRLKTDGFIGEVME